MFFFGFISKDILAYLLIDLLKVTLIYTLKRKKSTLNLSTHGTLGIASMPENLAGAVPVLC